MSHFHMVVVRERVWKGAVHNTHAHTQNIHKTHPNTLLTWGEEGGDLVRGWAASLVEAVQRKEGGGVLEDECAEARGREDLRAQWVALKAEGAEVDKEGEEGKVRCVGDGVLPNVQQSEAVLRAHHLAQPGERADRVEGEVQRPQAAQRADAVDPRQLVTREIEHL